MIIKTIEDRKVSFHVSSTVESTASQGITPRIQCRRRTNQQTTTFTAWSPHIVPNHHHRHTPHTTHHATPHHTTPHGPHATPRRLGVGAVVQIQSSKLASVASQLLYRSGSPAVKSAAPQRHNTDQSSLPHFECLPTCSLSTLLFDSPCSCVLSVTGVWRLIPATGLSSKS